MIFLWQSHFSMRLPYVVQNCSGGLHPQCSFFAHKLWCSNTKLFSIHWFSIEWLHFSSTESAHQPPSHCWRGFQGFASTLNSERSPDLGRESSAEPILIFTHFLKQLKHSNQSYIVDRKSRETVPLANNLGISCVGYQARKNWIFMNSF